MVLAKKLSDNYKLLFRKKKKFNSKFIDFPKDLQLLPKVL